MSYIFINSCIRGKDSRTLAIANNIVNFVKEKYPVEEININELNLTPYTESVNPINTPIENRFIEISKKIANSDGVIIAAPFWDMSFPSLLKVFLEKLSIADVMFKDDGTTCVGIARCPFMFYITTRGMNITDDSPLEQATPYLRALCHLWGIKKFDYVSAFNMDYSSEEENQKKILTASKVGINKIKDIKS